jgi:hypothetical protein
MSQRRKSVRRVGVCIGLLRNTTSEEQTGAVQLQTASPDGRGGWRFTDVGAVWMDGVICILPPAARPRRITLKILPWLRSIPIGSITPTTMARSPIMTQ